MRILVTGAFGNIGRHTVPLLLARGHRVRALSEKGDYLRGFLEAMGIGALPEEAGCCGRWCADTSCDSRRI